MILLIFLVIVISGCTGKETKDISSKTSTSDKKLSISGSTTIQPVSELLATAYMNDHPDIEITVTGGGSSKGIEDAGKDVVDIGSASRKIKESELEKYPEMKVYQIGASAIVIITSRMNSIDTITYEELTMLYNNKSENVSSMPGICNITTVIQRSEESGTEETFAGWLFDGQKNLDDSFEARDTGKSGDIAQISAKGNAEVLNLVKDNANSVGFVDFGYAESDPGVKILKVLDKGAKNALPVNMNSIREDILMELKNDESKSETKDSYYITGLTRPLNYVTCKETPHLVKDFIYFASDPSSTAYFNEIGYFSAAELRGEN
ncbi:phosphate transport system substrate-binding protein [Methanomicrobium sp. W14]|uniref:PstS family phosphate ABC transporter substrate-binding protein n=1 Tax=Methanomicrobium sp. W14 TaxID=2817839 RepID=UPI001AE7B8ED|nr:substrate-binding domain-containing protein [Methanomicrobium sp. W14]MBP2132187.1 phosphate transport system substrate-binding protein [Methanomicrobium sp. W14]